MNDVKRFVVELIEKVPEARRIYEDHLEDNDTLLPHVFMGEIARFVLQISENTSREDDLKELLSIIEDGLQSRHHDVQNLVALSFVENLCGEEHHVMQLIPLMGEATRREVRSLCGYE
ncbi:MAG: hypothetical protein KKC79_15365 [Gammaproteobacteria bacterium]|nr:hypothetical protein [Gammaproteobacteria bacterium]MBU1441687.1 hypothetical protein [Gammaproteobacteria bacterium]MBU2289289.1 hypothetical protein [Gammaproteobacteria bacterium]MBU2410014.1 hypothetical protein [Gammaproteobacteria bacterium]